MRLERLGFDDVVGCCRFPVEAGRNASIWEPIEFNVEECQFTIVFLLAGKLDSRVDVVEGLVEVGGWIRSPCAWSKSGAARDAVFFDNAEDVVHVDADMFRFLDALLVRDFHGPVHSVKHPEF